MRLGSSTDYTEDRLTSAQQNNLFQGGNGGEDLAAVLRGFDFDHPRREFAGDEFVTSSSTLPIAEIWVYLSGSPLFALILTLGAYWIGTRGL